MLYIHCEACGDPFIQDDENLFMCPDCSDEDVEEEVEVEDFVDHLNRPFKERIRQDKAVDPSIRSLHLVDEEEV